MTEKQWVESQLHRMRSGVAGLSDGEWKVQVEAGQKLAYANEVLRYSPEGLCEDHCKVARYETDVLFRDVSPTGEWIPRLVLECKFGSITTHDALTYSSKAETHKRVHPYLRYGILVANFDTALPGRLIRHGAFFDFMMVWATEEPGATEWNEFMELIDDEIGASRQLQSLLTESRHRTRKKFRLLHRPLRLRSNSGDEIQGYRTMTTFDTVFARCPAAFRHRATATNWRSLGHGPRCCRVPFARGLGGRTRTTRDGASQRRSDRPLARSARRRISERAEWHATDLGEFHHAEPFYSRRSVPNRGEGDRSASRQRARVCEPPSDHRGDSRGSYRSLPATSRVETAAID